MKANDNPLLVSSQSVSLSLPPTSTLANQPSEANVGGNVLLISSTLNPQR